MINKTIVLLKITLIAVCLVSGRFDMGNTNVNDPNFDKLKSEMVPDVILVRKIYADQKQKRRWKLRHFFPTGTKDTESVTK